MSTCKDCLHYEVCECEDCLIRVPEWVNKVEDFCGCFKNKADYVEIKHGYWKQTKGEVGNPFNNQVFDTIDLLVCSVCNEIFDVSEARNYCPNCGAKMDGERKESEVRE